MWPAFWMLGDNIGSVGWPTCGEIDIMENIGKEPSINHGSLHMPRLSGAPPTAAHRHVHAPRRRQAGRRLPHLRHRVGAERDQVLRRRHAVRDADAARPRPGATWVFDQPFFFILNVAVGGTWPGAPDSTHDFPQTMKVDWVRVYQPAK